ncbi:aminotransferase class V-fold PLP-dependent enzyme [Bacteriovoracaceae bacterium]|nr:aminotransferase class V-fold PLP-dependent enzyme [Bacteriovoracaceae bacterium]
MKLMKEDNFNEIKKDDYNWRRGRTWSLIYYKDESLDQILKQAYLEFFYESTLNPMVFSSAQKMEKFVVNFALEILNGNQLPNSSGLLTSGGTESIIMALKAYRNKARKKNKWWRNQNEIILPESTHVAFEKGAEILGLKVRKAKLKDDYSVDIENVKKLINRRTLILVGSAPQYPHGVIDDISSLSKLALENNIGLHVDCCLGGYFLPWLEKLGIKLPLFDFRLEGVSSISLDNHKFGYSAKGVSTLVYRDIDLMAEQFFITTDWCGGLYASPSFPGTKGIAPMATAYAAIKHLGQKGFIQNAQTLMNKTRELQKIITQNGELEIIGKPVMNVFAVKSNNPNLNVFVLADQLQKKGWHVDRQQKPNSIHFILNPQHLAHIDEFEIDFNQTVEELLMRPDKFNHAAEEGNAAIYGLVAKIPKGFNRFAKEEIRKVMKDMYRKNNHEYSDRIQMPKDDFKMKLTKKVLEYF